MEQFTIANAMQVQYRDLQNWKKILKEEVMIKLYLFCLEKNEKAISANRIVDIPRGQDLTNFLTTLMYQ